MSHLTFLIKRIERHGLIKVVVWMLALGITFCLITYALPPIFEAIGEFVADKIRDAHAHQSN